MGRSDYLGEAEVRNGIKKPKPGTITAIVWTLCKNISKMKSIARHKVRKKVIEEAVKKGILASTANTQYQRWVKFNKE